ncbi:MULTISPECIES: type IV pilus modification PilV family protein [Lysinibacillus]|uniref:type IV pilus modification PilV family protein n=1 Tax=Lysinibacillus TaxID=400634 RepID=UPI0006D24304|nr:MULTISPECIES: prepilin-type N-terminal cleavage/methylation domain-containing protein [Lysinibacillus]
MESIGYVNQQKGLTLVEVIASIVLISIILLSFMGIFMQSNKTTATSGDIVNATYIAQKEMENIFANKDNYPSIDKLAYALLYTSVANGDFEKHPGDRIQIVLKTEPLLQNSELTTIIIEVYEEVDGKNVLKSKIQNIYKIGG